MIAQFPALLSVDLSRNLTDDGVEALICLPTKLPSVTLTDNAFSEAGQRALTEHFGARVRF